MGKYYATYKCPLCGAFVRQGNSVETQQNKLPEILSMVVRNQMMQGHPVLYQAPMHVAHMCTDGNVGLAVFSGFKQDL